MYDKTKLKAVMNTPWETRDGKDTNMIRNYLEDITNPNVKLSDIPDDLLPHNFLTDHDITAISSDPRLTDVKKFNKAVYRLIQDHFGVSQAQFFLAKTDDNIFARIMPREVYEKLVENPDLLDELYTAQKQFNKQIYDSMSDTTENIKKELSQRVKSAIDQIPDVVSNWIDFAAQF